MALARDYSRPLAIAVTQVPLLAPGSGTLPVPGPVCKQVCLTVFLLRAQESDVKIAQEDRHGASFETPPPETAVWY